MIKRLITILVITAMILFITAMILSLSACGTKRTSEVTKGETSRMVCVEDLGSCYIVYDKYTEVMYAVSNGAYNRGTFTLLVDADGSPLLYEK